MSAPSTPVTPPITLPGARPDAPPCHPARQATSSAAEAERIWEETPLEWRRQVIHLLGHLLYKQVAAGVPLNALNASLNAPQSSPVRGQAASSKEAAHERPAAHS